MWLGYDVCASKRTSRSLLKFDTSEFVVEMSNAGISGAEATLYLFLANSCDPSERSHTISLHRATSLWSSDSVTWATQPSMTAALDSLTIPPQDESPWGWYGFDVTELVRGWVNGDYLNLGVVVRGPEDSQTGARLVFVTSDYAGGLYAPRIEFRYGSQASQVSSVPASFAEPDCLPEALAPTLSQDESYHIFGAPACPAD
jgi:hypothetical protein